MVVMAPNGFGLLFVTDKWLGTGLYSFVPAVPLSKNKARRAVLVSPVRVNWKEPALSGLVVASLAVLTVTRGRGWA